MIANGLRSVWRRRPIPGQAAERMYALLEYVDLKHRNSTNAEWAKWVEDFVNPALQDYIRALPQR